MTSKKSRDPKESKSPLFHRMQLKMPEEKRKVFFGDESDSDRNEHNNNSSVEMEILEKGCNSVRSPPPLYSSGSLSEEQVKDLFTDPALRKETKKRMHHNSGRHSSFGSGSESIAVCLSDASKEDEESPNSAGNSLMTRRITIAGGFLDIALFTANCEQLKFVLELGNLHEYYRAVLALLITSLVLQLLVGFTMFLLGSHVIQKVNDEWYSNCLNHVTMGLVALITIVNIFISTFGPKGKVMVKLLGAFSYANTSSPLFNAFFNMTKNGLI